MFINRWDPGPCPVDDMPHTTCTSPDYGLTQPLLAAGQTVRPVVQAIQRPGAFDQMFATTTTVISKPVTTKTYRRKKR